MTISPLAGKPAPKEMLVDLAHLEREYFERRPDLDDPEQQVSLGTSGHRGSSLRGSFTEAHILAITQAICEFRRMQVTNGPLFLGRDTHALSGPAQRTALEVLAGNHVHTVIQQNDGVTPTPVISRAILVQNRGRSERLADDIVITPSHNPPEDGGFKYKLTHGGPADIDVTGWVENRANDLMRKRNAGVKRLGFAAALRVDTTLEEDFVLPYVTDLRNVVDVEAIRAAGLKLAVDPLDAPATTEQRARLKNLLPEAVMESSSAGEPIIAKLSHAPGNNAPIDGLEVITRSGWFAARPSGTEAVYKIYAESFEDEGHLEAIVDAARAMVDAAVSGWDAPATESERAT